MNEISPCRKSCIAVSLPIKDFMNALDEAELLHKSTDPFFAKRKQTRAADPSDRLLFYKLC